MATRHTACKLCGQDIEQTIAGGKYRKGEWRDRGNNTHCPTAEGDAGQLHEPMNPINPSDGLMARQAAFHSTTRPFMPAEQTVDLAQLQRALGNCYMTARRELRRLNNTGRVELIHGLDSQSVERWQHIVRFCEEAGCKSDILRAALPTELTDGGI